MSRVLGGERVFARVTFVFGVFGRVTFAAAHGVACVVVFFSAFVLSGVGLTQDEDPHAPDDVCSVCVCVCVCMDMNMVFRRMEPSVCVRIERLTWQSVAQDRSHRIGLGFRLQGLGF